MRLMLRLYDHLDYAPGEYWHVFSEDIMVQSAPSVFEITDLVVYKNKICHLSWYYHPQISRLQTDEVQQAFYEAIAQMIEWEFRIGGRLQTMRLVTVPSADLSSWEKIEISLGSGRKRKYIYCFSVNYFPISRSVYLCNSAHYHSAIEHIVTRSDNDLLNWWYWSVARLWLFVVSCV